MHVFSSLFKTSHISIRYKVESIAGNILCWVKKPDYKSIRKKLIKSKCIDDNTGFTIISKDIFISKSDNTIMIIFQDFKQIFNVDKIFSLKELKLNRQNLDHLELLGQLTNLSFVYLYPNQRTKISSEIGNLTNLPKHHAQRLNPIDTYYDRIKTHTSCKFEERTLRVFWRSKSRSPQNPD